MPIKERFIMDLNPFDLRKMQELLDVNKDLLDSFFNNNPFDDKFFSRLKENGITVGDVKSNPNGNINNNITNREIPMDTIHRKHELQLIFEIPGINRKEDIDIKVLGSNLVIEGEIRSSYMISDSDKTKFERKVGHFSKKVPIPIIYDSKRIRARYNNGLLEIRFPILRQNNQEKINVQFPQTED